MKVGKMYLINGQLYTLTGARFPKCGPLFDFIGSAGELNLTRRELALNRIEEHSGG